MGIAKNKWEKYSFMRKSNDLAPYLPETREMTKANFVELITKYGKVYIKPIGGSRGFGVIQVSLQGKDDYKIHIENKKTTIKGKEDAMNYIEKMIGSRAYMIQQPVPLATVDQRPFDLRVIVQRKKNSTLWSVTAKIAKVAGKGYIVTNITRSNGDLLSVESALRLSSLKSFSQQTLLSNINKVALLSAKRLKTLFPRQRIYGLDIGLDHRGHVWIIEANLYPSMSHFIKSKNKTMYDKIKKYKAG